MCLLPASVAAAQTHASVDTYDCLHSCQPGPVDTWARLLLALVDDNRDSFLGGDRPSPSRFFAGRLANRSTFLARSIGTSATLAFEGCTENPECRDSDEPSAVRQPPRLACCAVSTQPAATAEPWWPFPASRENDAVPLQGIRELDD